jgi:hypothetical protein
MDRMEQMYEANMLWKKNMKRDRLRGMLLYKSGTKKLRDIQITNATSNEATFVYKGDEIPVLAHTVTARMDSKLYEFVQMDVLNEDGGVKDRHFRINPKNQNNRITRGRTITSFFGELHENREYFEDLFYDGDLKQYTEIFNK